MREDKDITAEIQTLREMKPKVRRQTMFGDDNHEAIEAQILALERRMTENQIFDEWPEDIGPDVHARDSAIEAHSWLIEESDEKPSEGWAELAK